MKIQASWLNVLFLALLAVPFAVRADEPASLATCIASVPKVDLIHGSESRVLKMGASIYQGDRVKSGPLGSAGLVLSDGTVLRLSHNSETTLSPDAQSGSSSLVELLKGLLLASVHKQGRSTFQIHSSQGVAAVKGTQLQVEASDSQTEVKVLSGVVELSSPAGGAPLSIGAGEKAVSYADRVGGLKKMNAAEIASLKVAFKDRVFQAKSNYSQRVKDLKK